MNWRLVLLLPVALGVWNYWQGRPVSHPPGILVHEAPVQQALNTTPPLLVKPGYRITPLESFSLEARVLGRERYRFDRAAHLSPIDLALGWGPMSDQAVLEHIDISQSGRFYFWHVERFPIPQRDIETHSANMHMIPATREVEHQLLNIRAGQLMTLHGYLVEVHAADGWQWRSSLTREDTGSGACELVWVESLEVR